MEFEWIDPSLDSEGHLSGPLLLSFKVLMLQILSYLFASRF